MPTPADTLRLSISTETSQGVLPPTPAFDVVRTTGEGISYEVTTTVSDEISSVSRGVTDNVLTGATVSGDINFELSDFVAFENMLASGVGSVWGADPKATGAPYPTDLGEESAIYDSSTMSTFTIEKQFTSTALDTGATSTLYQRFSGCTADTFNLSITPNEIITGTFGFLGMEMTTPTGPVSGATYNEAGTNPVMSAPLVTGIEILSHTTNGTEGTPVAWLSGSCFTGCDIAITNNGRGLVCIGTLGNKGTSLGRFEVSLTGSLYYNTNDPLTALIDQTEYQFRVTCNDDDGNFYTFFFPRVKFATATALASGVNTDVMVEWTMQALVDGFQGYSMYVGRTATPPIVTTASAKPKKE